MRWLRMQENGESHPGRSASIRSLDGHEQTAAAEYAGITGGLGYGKRDAASAASDSRGSAMAGAQSGWNQVLWCQFLQIAAGGNDDAVTAHDESAIHAGELAQCASGSRVQHTAVFFR